MVKRTPEQWQALFASHKTSGLSQAQCCKEHKLCPKYFSLRRRQLAGREGQPKVTSSLIKVQRPVAPPVSSVSILYQGIEIRFAQVHPDIIVNVVKRLA
ncbi:hypothetical protein AB835_13565 [Candidatus Endobugula sertula]|uniref:Transposase n=1 Tax=Candidatus Endobugula sertula TaxID=62101 RepID=A0A1D2QLT6_9GAMM|nr:hypothetical protein AB835_13565 [Candidatus Endobugula sertula]